MKPPYFVIPNTDASRHALYPNLPEEACEIEVAEPWNFNLTLVYHHYFLDPDTDPSVGQQYVELSTKPLFRK